MHDTRVGGFMATPPTERSDPRADAVYPYTEYVLFTSNVGRAAVRTTVCHMYVKYLPVSSDFAAHEHGEGGD